MAQVYLSLGSNIEREKNLRLAMVALSEKFGALQVSSVYESESVGFVGNNFFNLAVGLKTQLSLSQLLTVLHKIEGVNNRGENDPKCRNRTIDIDVLTYGQLIGEAGGISLPRAEISKNAFVLRPMADIACDIVHPFYKCSYGEMWSNYKNDSQKLWPIYFEWALKVC